MDTLINLCIIEHSLPASCIQDTIKNRGKKIQGTKCGKDTEIPHRSDCGNTYGEFRDDPHGSSGRLHHYTAGRHRIPAFLRHGRRYDQRQAELRAIPPGIHVYEIMGPLFFGAAGRLGQIVVKDATKCLILRMKGVPVLDITAVDVLNALQKRCRKSGIPLIFSSFFIAIAVSIWDRLLTASMRNLWNVGRSVGVWRFVVADMSAGIEKYREVSS